MGTKDHHERFKKKLLFQLTNLFKMWEPNAVKAIQANKLKTAVAVGTGGTQEAKEVSQRKQMEKNQSVNLNVSSVQNSIVNNTIYNNTYNYN